MATPNTATCSTSGTAIPIYGTCIVVVASYMYVCGESLGFVVRLVTRKATAEVKLSSEVLWNCGYRGLIRHYLLVRRSVWSGQCCFLQQLPWMPASALASRPSLGSSAAIEEVLIHLSVVSVAVLPLLARVTSRIFFRSLRYLGASGNVFVRLLAHNAVVMRQYVCHCHSSILPYPSVDGAARVKTCVRTIARRTMAADRGIHPGTQFSARPLSGPPTHPPTSDATATPLRSVAREAMFGVGGIGEPEGGSHWAPKGFQNGPVAPPPQQVGQPGFQNPRWAPLATRVPAIFVGSLGGNQGFGGNHGFPDFGGLLSGNHGFTIFGGLLGGTQYFSVRSLSEAISER
jgi:hypothetical protein